jgi:hypothetical protein
MMRAMVRPVSDVDSAQLIEASVKTISPAR